MIKKPSQTAFHKPALSKKIKYLSYTIVLIVAAILYGQTLAPTVVQIDSGELAAVQAVAGIAHPTGYPLFTMLGHVFLKIPLFTSKIFQANLLSLVWCLVGVLFFLKSLDLCLSPRAMAQCIRVPESNSSDRRRSHRSAQRKRSDELLPLFSCVVGGLYLAFSRTFWMQSTSVEVYALHIALVSIIIFTLLKAYITGASWLWIAAALALGLSNHMTTILLIPGVAVLFFQKTGIRRPAWKTMLLMMSVFLVVYGLIVLYLPLRAAQQPVLNWGNPVTWENFLRHVSGKQYRVWLFSSSDVALKHLNDFLSAFPGEFGWLGLLLGVVGIYSSFMSSPRLAVFLLISFLATVFYSINYDIHDLESYFLLAYLVFAFWIGFGFLAVVQILRKPIWQYLFMGLVASGLSYQVISNYSEADSSDLYVYEDYTTQALRSLPDNAMLLSYQWDYLISPAYYFQFVEGRRRDVAIVDKELLRRSWYFDQMKTNYPDVMDDIDQEVDSFLTALAPFEQGGDYDASVLEKRYRRLITRMIETNMDERSVFIAPELVEGELRRGELTLPTGLHLIPDLFFFRIVYSDAYVPLEKTDVSIRFPRQGNRYSRIIENFVSNMWMYRALYEIQYGNTENARHMRGLLLSHFPDIPLPPSLAGL